MNAMAGEAEAGAGGEEVKGMEGGSCKGGVKDVGRRRRWSGGGSKRWGQGAAEEGAGREAEVKP